MGATKLTILASAAQTASANSAQQQVPTLRELLVTVDVTAVSGTTPTMHVWLQASNDNGATWFDLPYEMRLTDANASGTQATGGQQPPAYLPTSAGAPVENTTGGRNINGSAAIAAVGKWVAIYRTFGDYVRARWIIAGTTPSFTFSVKAVGK